MRARVGQVIGLSAGVLSCVGRPPAPPQSGSGGPASTSSTGDPVTSTSSTGEASTSGGSADPEQIQHNVLVLGDDSP